MDVFVAPFSLSEFLARALVEGAEACREMYAVEELGAFSGRGPSAEQLGGYCRKVIHWVTSEPVDPDRDKRAVSCFLLVIDRLALIADQTERDCVARQAWWIYVGQFVAADHAAGYSPPSAA